MEEEKTKQQPTAIQCYLKPHQQLVLYISKKDRDVPALLQEALARHAEDEPSISKMVRKVLRKAFEDLGMPHDDLREAVRQLAKRRRQKMNRTALALLRKYLPGI